ncbi:MAG: hypothetical protein FD174_1831 [Geobacteraceae bacterium]|nr:MAG: hypothetical protein FD174_1831 [Geobacteraceae bacterium]
MHELYHTWDYCALFICRGNTRNSQQIGKPKIETDSKQDSEIIKSYHLRSPPSKENLAVSRQMYLINQEPFLDVKVLELKDNAGIKFTITNNSNVSVSNIKIFERFYASKLNDLSAQNAIGPQAVVPTVEIDLLKPSVSRKCETSSLFISRSLISEIEKGDTGGFFEFRMSFRHGATGKQYSQVHRFLILPSNTGWQYKEVYDESMWALNHFKAE